MLKLSDDFYFKRKNYVKDLTNVTSLLKGTGLLTLSVEDLLCSYEDEPTFKLENVDKIIVPVTTPEDVKNALAINPAMRPFMIIMLPDADHITKDLLDSFYPISHTSIAISKMIDEDICALIKKINNLASENFRKFQACTYGYLFTFISDTDKIIVQYSEAFISDPFWCIINAYWDFYSISNKTLQELEGILYQCRFIASNLLSREGYSPSANRPYRFDYYRSGSRKDLLLSSNKVYLTDSTVHTETVNSLDQDQSQVQISLWRKFYDIIIPVPSDNFSLALPFQNYSITGSPASTPEFVHLIEDALRGERK